LTTSCSGCGLCFIRRRKRVLSFQFFWRLGSPCWLYRPLAAETAALFAGRRRALQRLRPGRLPDADLRDPRVTSDTVSVTLGRLVSTARMARHLMHTAASRFEITIAYAALTHVGAAHRQAIGWIRCVKITA
jgi:hypothetical protein